MPDLVKLGLWDEKNKRIKDNAKQAVQKNKQAIRESNVRSQASKGGEAAKRIGQAGISSSSRLNLSSAKPASSARTETKTQGDNDLTGKSGRFFLARIGEIAQSNPEEGKKLYDMYESERANPSSPLYDIYANPTSNNAKYNAQTEKAMGEWQALQQELSYWAKNDRNYSDDEIISRINWKNYPTLSKMNNTKNGGQTVYLTQPIGYNEDAMYGVLWAARNPELSTGDYSMDAVLSAAGRGKEYQRDDTKAARLDPTSKSYNPYLVGSTMDSEMQHFGLNGFDADWLGSNLQYRGTDEYASIYKAEQTTEKAEKELADLQAELEADLASGFTLDEAFSEELLDDYPTLRSMQQGLDKGSPVSITRSVAYDLPSLKSAYDKSYQQLYGTETNADYAASVAESTGAQPKKNAALDKVAGASILNQRQYFGAIWQTGTDDEKKSIASSGNVDYAPSVEDIQSSIQQGTSGKQGAMSSKQLTVSQQTSNPFFEAMDAWNGAGKDIGFSDESKKLLEYAGISPEAVSPDDSGLALKIMTGLNAAALNGDYQAQSYLGDFERFFEQLQYQASLAADTSERKAAADEQLAAIDQQWKEAFGDDTPEYRAHKYAMETIYSFKDAPKPDWGAYDAIGWAAQQEGATEESIARTAQSALSINKQQIAYLESLMAQSEQYGVPEEYLANMQATVENLEKTNRLIASYSLKNSKDYAQGVAAFDEMAFGDIASSYPGAVEIVSEIRSFELASDINLPAYANTDDTDDNTFVSQMDENERSNFKYLYTMQGEESAMAYYNDLKSQLVARYAQKQSERAQRFGEEAPILASIGSILESPFQLEGVAYTIIQALKGEQADPNSPNFSANRNVSGSRQGTKNAFADAVGDNETAKNIFNFFYDALMSTGDSLVSAAVGGATGVANAGLAIMSTEAASNAMQEALYKGADSKTAAFAGLAAGAAEAITEKVPFEKITELYHAGSAGGKVLKLIADNVIGEGVGEGASEYLGALGDYLVMGDDSDFVQSVEQYKADGMTEDEAVRQAVNDLTERALYAALAGTVSGVASSGASYAAGKLTGSNADVQGDQQEQQEQQTNERTETARVSEKGTAIQASDGTNTETPVETSAETSTEAVQPVSDSAASDTQNVTADNAVNVLYKAQQNGVGQMQQTASVDAVLRSFGVEDATATAAAKNVIASGDLAKVTKVIENAPDKSKAAQAIAMAMLNPDSESAATLADMGDTITADDVVGLMQMYDLDMQDNAAVQAMGTAVEDSQVADETVAALGQMDSAGAKSAQSSLKKAKQAEKTFRDNLAKESANVNAADQALESARQARIQNTNPDTIAAEKKALQNRSKAMEKWDAAKQQHQEAQQAMADARAELNAVQEAVVNQARTEALGKQQERQVVAQEAYINEQAAEAASAEIRRQSNNVLSMEADEFVDKYFADTPDDVKRQVKERYMAYDGQTRDVTKDMYRFASRISKKFGLKITFTDSHNVFEGANLGGNEIVLDKNATQGDIIKRVLVHEVVHAAESSDVYTELSDAVLSAYYNGEVSKMEADLKVIADQYQNQAGQAGADVARSELVARRLSEMLSDNEETLNRLVEEKPNVAERLWRSIKEFIAKLRGVNDPELDKLMKIEKKLEKALGSRTGGAGITQFLIERGTGGVDVVVVEEDILKGVPKREWPKRVRNIMASRFPNGVPVGNNVIRINRDSRKEVTNSKDTMWLKHNDFDTYQDKLRATANSDEIIKASRDYVNEAPTHDRKDRIVDFGRGEVSMRIGNKEYDAEVVVGYDADGNMRLYDFVRMTRTGEKETGEPFEEDTSRDSHAGLLGLTVSENGSFVKKISDGAEIIRGGATKFSLPSNDVLDQQIAQYQNELAAEEEGTFNGNHQQNYGTGERQFAGKTVQESSVVPDWAKREFLKPENLNYERDTNRAQVERGWKRIQENGYESERDRLLNLDSYSSDDTAEANLMMAIALREDTADPETFMSLALKYNKEGTKEGQALQARKLFSRMSPTGARVWIAGKLENRLDETIRRNTEKSQMVNNRAKLVADSIQNMQSGDQLLHLNEGGDFTIDEGSSRWGIPINEQQEALIDHYNLNNVARPGLFYNRATRKQRMLEAILSTPNPLEATGLGLNLIQRLEYLDIGETVITNADLNYIGTQLGVFEGAGGDNGGREADLALSRAYEAYGNIAPASFGEKMRTWNYTTMLLSITSSIRNVIGNAGQNVANATAHGIAVEIDKLFSKKTGQRTVDHLDVQERIDGWRGFANETKNTFLDYFVDKTITQRGEAKYNTHRRGRTFENGVLEAANNLEGFLMSYGDRNFWKKAFLNSMAEQQKLSDQGLLFNGDGTTRTHEQMVEQAEIDANYATFTENNELSNALSQLKQVPVVGTLANFVMPFTGVPTNIARRMIQYSPIGLATTVIKQSYQKAIRDIASSDFGQNTRVGKKITKNVKSFDQRAFVDGLSRGLTGTAAFGIGMLAGAIGLFKPGTSDEDKEKRQDLKSAMGLQYTPTVYNPLTGEYVNLSVFAPAISPVIMGYTAYESIKENESWVQALLNASLGSADQILDASFMSGLSDLFKGYGSAAENTANAVISNGISQFVPAFMLHLSNALDPYVRDTKDKNALVQAVKSGLINRIPGLRQALLAEKVDVTGESVRTKEGWRNFIDPFTTTDRRDEPVLDELLRLSDMTGEINMLPSDALRGSKMTLTVSTKNGKKSVSKKVTLDSKGKETYKKRYGELWLEGGKTLDSSGTVIAIEGVRKLIESDKYQQMDDGEKSKAIEKILKAAKTGASMEALTEYGADE